MEMNPTKFEHRYKVLLDSLLEGFQIISPDYRYLYVNDAVVKHARCSKEDLLGRTMMDAFPGIDRTAMFSVLKECMETRTYRRMENEFTYPDGSTGWFELSFEPVKEGVAIMSIDVTDRKRAEESNRRLIRILMAIRNVNQLITMEKNRKNLLQQVCDKLIGTEGYDHAWIALVDKDGQFVSATEAAHTPGQGSVIGDRRLTNCIRFALTNDGVYVAGGSDGSCPECPGKEGGTYCRVMLCRLESGGTVHGVLGVLVPPDLVIGDDERSLFREVAGDVSHALYVMAVEDERERVHEVLRASEERLKTIFDSVSDVIYYKDSDGRFVEVNRAFCEMLGYTRDELLAMDPKDLETSENAVNINERMQKVRAEGHLVFETIYKGRDGRTIPVEVNTRIATIGGKSSVLSVARDITIRRRVEHLQRRREQDEIFGFLASALPVFASSMPSKVRNTIVASFAGLFEKNVRPRYEQYIKGRETGPSGRVDRDGARMVIDYHAWLSNFFSNFGIDVEAHSDTTCYILDFKSCPWTEQSRGNPIFCLLCRTMIIRSYMWTNLPGDVSVDKTIADGGDMCRFRIGGVTMPIENER